MPDKLWKAEERKWAKALGGKRIPNPGQGFADVIAPPLAVQIKTRESLPNWFLDAFEQAERDARKIDHIAALGLTYHPGRGIKSRRFIVLDLEEFVILMNAPWREE